MSSPSEPQRYRLSGEVQAVQWRGDNAAELEAFAGPCFDALTEPCDDDPDATAAVLDGTHSTWKLLYTGDWVTCGPVGFHAVRAAQFDAVYVPANDGEVADARHERDVLRGIAADLEQRLNLALIDLGIAGRARVVAERSRVQAEAERDQACALLAEVRPFLSQICHGELYPDLEQRARDLEQRIVDQFGDGDDSGEEVRDG